MGTKGKRRRWYDALVPRGWKSGREGGFRAANCSHVLGSLIGVTVGRHLAQQRGQGSNAARRWATCGERASFLPRAASEYARFQLAVAKCCQCCCEAARGLSSPLDTPATAARGCGC